MFHLILVLGLILGRKPWCDPFRPHPPPFDIYIIGKLWIIAICWRPYAFNWPKFLQALRILIKPWDWNETTTWDCDIRYNFNLYALLGRYVNKKAGFASWSLALWTTCFSLLPLSSAPVSRQSFKISFKISCYATQFCNLTKFSVVLRSALSLFEYELH